MEYNEFLESKKHLLGEFGFEPNFIPDMAFDFQAFIIKKARHGRSLDSAKQDFML